MIPDQLLTDHFSLFDLTQTTHADLQEMNRQVDELQISKLGNLAVLLEILWTLLEVPLVISSGYRCPALNAAVGSSMRSQHLLCEATDFVPKGLDITQAFKSLRQFAKDKKFLFGQLIYEKAERSYGVTEWIHISLGAPWRQVERCGQILTMNDGQYQLIETILQS